MAKCVRNKNCTMTQNEDNTFFRTLRLSKQNLFNYRLFNESLTFSSLLYFNKTKRKHAFLNGLDSRKQNGQFSSEI